MSAAGAVVSKMEIVAPALSPAASALLDLLGAGGWVVEHYHGPKYRLSLYRPDGVRIYADAGRRAAWREVRSARLVRRTGWLGPEAYYEVVDGAVASCSVVVETNNHFHLRSLCTRRAFPRFAFRRQ
jgi:hypothetical protein